jgi:hypothetical protein
MRNERYLSHGIEKQFSTIKLKGNIMYEIKEIEVYTPKSKIASTWSVNKNCSDSTKEKLSCFLEKCEKLEMIFTNAGCDLLEFYWFTSDDDLNLNIELDKKDYKKFKDITQDLKDFFIDDLVCLNEDTDFLNLDMNKQSGYGSYVSSYKNKVTIQVALDWKHWNSYIPTPDYFYASMW